VSTVRSWKFSVLGGVEEFWVPILIRILSALLATILTAVALPDRATWKLCMWVWYVYSVVHSIVMKNYREHKDGSQPNTPT
jgi:hypothetical protein